MAREGTPAFTSLTLHQDRKWGFEFWYPSEWQQFSFPDGREGVILAPDPTDAATSFSVEVKDIGEKVGAQDAAILYAGFQKGLRALPECKIESHERWVAGALVGLEAKYTFREGDALRKRWVRLLYEGSRQYHLVAQGADPDEYAYWLPMLFEAMMTVKIN